MYYRSYYPGILLVLPCQLTDPLPPLTPYQYPASGFVFTIHREAVLRPSGSTTGGCLRVPVGRGADTGYRVRYREYMVLVVRGQ